MIIGFAGRARHGKDYCASHAQTLLRDRAVTRGFAQSLKERVARALPEFKEECYSKPEWMRNILQAVGGNVREADPNFWVRVLMEWWESDRIKRGFYNGPKRSAEVLLVPDVRYPNEVEAIKKRGGKVIRVVRTVKCTDEHIFTHCPGEALYLAEGVDPNHSSECSIEKMDDSNFDAIIFAGSGMTDYLKAMVEENLKQWGLLDA